MDEAEPDLSVYTRAPIFDAAGGTALGHKLLQNALPRGEAAPPRGQGKARAGKAARGEPHEWAPVRRAEAQVKKALAAVEKDWGARNLLTRQGPIRPIDLLSDAAWRGSRERATAWLTLPADRFTEVARAEKLLSTFFPTGLDFTQLDFAKQWAETEKRVKLIDEDPALEKDWLDLVGPQFLAQVRHTHALYGKAIGTTAQKLPAPDAPALLPQVRALQRAMNRYGVQLVALYQDTTDAKLRGWILQALAPFDEHRAGAARREGGTETPPGQPESSRTEDGEPDEALAAAGGEIATAAKQEAAGRQPPAPRTARSSGPRRPRRHS